MILILKMGKRKRNLNLKDLPVLVYQAVALKVEVMILIVNTVIKKLINLNQNLRTKKVKQKVLNENEDHVLEVNHIQDQNVAGHVQDIMIEDLLIVIDQDAVVDHQFHAMEGPKSIKTNEIVLLVQMNQEVLNIVIDDNNLVKIYYMVFINFYVINIEC